MDTMTGGSLQIWMILLLGGILVGVVISVNNYYVPRYGEAKAKIMSQRPARERNNCIINISKRIDEEYFMLMTLLMYVLISMVFMIENRLWIVDQVGHNLLAWFFLFVFWLVMAFFTMIFCTAVMLRIEQNSKSELKEYYSKHYGVTLIYQDKFDDEFIRF